MQDPIDLHAGIDAIGALHERYPRDAVSAAAEQRTAEAARLRQVQATAVVKTALEATQKKAEEATALATRISAEKHAVVVMLAKLRKTSAAIEQARQDRLTAADQLAAVPTVDGGPVTAPRLPTLVASGGSTAPTEAQLDPP